MLVVHNLLVSVVGAFVRLDVPVWSYVSMCQTRFISFSIEIPRSQLLFLWWFCFGSKCDSRLQFCTWFVMCRQNVKFESKPLNRQQQQSACFCAKWIQDEFVVFQTVLRRSGHQLCLEMDNNSKKKKQKGKKFSKYTIVNVQTILVHNVWVTTISCWPCMHNCWSLCQDVTGNLGKQILQIISAFCRTWHFRCGLSTVPTTPRLWHSGCRPTKRSPEPWLTQCTRVTHKL